MKRWIPFIMIAFVFACGQALGSKRISARLDFACFPAGSMGGRLMLVIGIDGKSMTYKQLPNKSYQSTATFAIAVNDSLKNYFGEKIDFNSPVLQDSSLFGQEFITTKCISLPPGRYQVEMVVFDGNSSDTTKERIQISIVMPNTSKEAGISQLLLLNSSAFSADIPVYQQDARSFRLSDFYSEKDTALSFYGEMTGLHHKLKQGQSFVSRYRILDPASRRSMDEFGKMRRQKFKGDLAFKADLQIKNLPSGNYLLNWDLVDSTGKVVAKTERYFQKSNPGLIKEVVPARVVQNNESTLAETIAKMPMPQARLMIESLLPLTKASEQPTIEYLRKQGSEREIRNYLASFWPKHSPENPAGAMQQYADLIAIAEKNYATKAMHAYQTDRGRVFLQYGQPNVIENEYSDRFRKAMQNLNTVPYEVWYFYNLDKPVKQNDVIFVFVQENRGNDNYRLLHSTGLGEIRNREWRKAVENNGTYNFDRLDANDRYDPSDSKKYR